MPEPSPPAMDTLLGRTIGVTGERKSAELGSQLQRRGATVRFGQAIHIQPLAQDEQLREATSRLCDEPPDLIVISTGVGFRSWLQAAEHWGLAGRLSEVLAGAKLLARGPKATGAIRGAGFRESFAADDETTAGLLAYLGRQQLRGTRIAVQLHGQPAADIVEPLQRTGAEVVALSVYRVLPPPDLAGLDALLRATTAGHVDALTFTSAPAAAFLLQRAADLGQRDELLRVVRSGVFCACVGPVTAEPLWQAGLRAAHPERMRQAALIALLEQRLGASGR